MKTFPNIETDRLILRQTIEKDWKEILFLRTSKEVNKYIKSSLKPPSNEVDTKAFVDKIYTKGFENDDNINWSVVIKNMDKMIGSVCYWNFSEDRKKAEIGYAMIPDFYNLGYMREALKAILGYGKNKLNLEVVEAFTHCKNEASKRLLVKCKFALKEGEVDEGNEDNLIYQKRFKI